MQVRLDRSTLHLLDLFRDLPSDNLVPRAPDPRQLSHPLPLREKKLTSSGCVCCCSKGSAFVRALPRGCDCARSIAADDVSFAAAVAAILLVPTMFASCWFGAGGCCGSGSPFVPTPARQQGARVEQMNNRNRTMTLPTAAVVSPPPLPYQSRR